MTLKKGAQRIACLLIALSMCLQFSACKKDKGNANESKGVQAGIWNDTIFTNEWSNIKVTLPNNWKVATKDQIQEIYSLGSDIFVNDGLATKAELDLSLAKVIYDFYIYNPEGTPSALLMYEQVSFSEEIYLTALKTSLEKVTSASYSFLGSESKAIAGNTYLVGKFSLSNGQAYQKYYLRKVDNVIMCLIATYKSAQESAIDSLIDSIEKAK